MTGIAEHDLQATIAAWDQAAWSLAALALTARGDGPPELTAAAKELLAATGLAAAPGTPLPGLGTATPGQIASQAAAVLHEASAVAGGRGYEWGTQSDEALLAQGRVSAQRAVTVARFLLPVMGDLAGRLAAPGARLLDVGTGTGALAVAFAQVFPQVQVLGIDISGRALGLARQAIAVGGVGARVTVREQDVADFADDAGFDLAWLPAPFLAGPALQAGLPRVAAALRPGGWLIVGHGKSGGTPAQDALTRLKTLAWGGTPLDDAAACRLLGTAGLTSVRTVPTQAGAPAVTIGQNQPDHRPGDD
jgi:SAM-dependent methyltransferase